MLEAHHPDQTLGPDHLAEQIESQQPTSLELFRDRIAELGQTALTSLAESIPNPRKAGHAIVATLAAVSLGGGLAAEAGSAVASDSATYYKDSLTYRFKPGDERGVKKTDHKLWLAVKNYRHNGQWQGTSTYYGLGSRPFHVPRHSRCHITSGVVKVEDAVTDTVTTYKWRGNPAGGGETVGGPAYTKYARVVASCRRAS